MLGSLGWFETTTIPVDKSLIVIEALITAQFVSYSVSLFSTESVFALFDFR